MIKRLISISLTILAFIACDNNSQITSVNSNNTQFDFSTLKNVKNLDIDSLYRIASLLQDDTIKVNQLLTTYKLSIRNRPIRIDILNKALKLSKDLDYNTGIAKCLTNKGLDYRYKHEYLKAIKYHKEAIEYYEKSWDKKSRIKNLNSLGVAYRRINIEDEAIKYYFEALNLSEREEHTKSMAIAMNGIGNAYIILEKYDYAIKYFKLSLDLEILCNSVRGTGYDYSNLGEAYMYKEEYDSSFFYHSKALEVANLLNIEGDKAIIYSSIGQMYQHKGDFEMALKYYQDAIPILSKLRRKRLLSFSLINVGKIYKLIGDYSKSKSYINRGLNISKDISTKDNIVSGYEALADLDEIQGNYKSALSEYKNMVLYRDSIFNIKSHYNIAAMDIKYESAKKDDKINRLNLETEVQKSKNAIQILAIIILGSIAIIFVLYNRIRIKNQDIEIQNMRDRIEKHLKHITKLEKENGKASIQKINKEEYGLSAREEEVLSLIALGLKNQEIADKMFVSISTVKTHTKNIYEKLEVRNRIEAAQKAKAL
ncbi:MAG: tetratricopeptide repeat protein [Flavobacteriales bacterium]|nr:tetratricopeptide repeat protein [Flavobacteriales bacterium]